MSTYNLLKNSMLRRPVEFAQYVSVRYGERLAEVGIEPSGSSHSGGLT